MKTVSFLNDGKSEEIVYGLFMYITDECDHDYTFCPNAEIDDNEIPYWIEYDYKLGRIPVFENKNTIDNYLSNLDRAMYLADGSFYRHASSFSYFKEIRFSVNKYVIKKETIFLKDESQTLTLADLQNIKVKKKMENILSGLKDNEISMLKQILEGKK